MKATYIGNGNYLNGIPARDLTDEEWDALTPEQQAEVKASGLYEFGEQGADVVEAPAEEPPGEAS